MLWIVATISGEDEEQQVKQMNHAMAKVVSDIWNTVACYCHICPSSKDSWEFISVSKIWQKRKF